ncbi:MAG TPA: tetratricopeptide repeat protein [Bryobacteraceae bacterium]|nr:tetratricopeptide repeat protein [Bryobacteraceae bacterium]
MISGYYYFRITRELNKAIDAYLVLVRIDPRNPRPHNRLGLIYSARGESEKALGESQEALRLEPRVLVYVGNLMRRYLALDRFDEAKAVAQKAFAQKLDGALVHENLLLLAYIQEDHATQEKEIQWLAGKEDEYVILTYEAANATVHGQRRKAKELYQQTAEMARRQGLADVRFVPLPAVIDAWMGDCEAARNEKSSPALVYCGDASALRLADEQAAKNPPPNPDAAALLYRRGLAGLRAGKGAEAAAEFQKILDHRGNNWGPFYSVSFLGLARSSTLTGDTGKARKAYEDFFALWKDADSDIPVLIQARKEYAALN